MKMKLKICGCDASVVYLFLKQIHTHFYSIKQGAKPETFDIITKPDSIGFCTTRVVLTYIDDDLKATYITLSYSQFDRVAIEGITSKKEV